MKGPTFERLITKFCFDFIFSLFWIYYAQYDIWTSLVDIITDPVGVWRKEKYVLMET